MKSKRIVRKATWRASKEPNYDQWYMNAKPDTRSKEQIEFDNRRKRIAILMLIAFPLITLIGMILAR